MLLVIQATRSAARNAGQHFPWHLIGISPGKARSLLLPNLQLSKVTLLPVQIILSDLLVGDVLTQAAHIAEKQAARLPPHPALLLLSASRG